MSRYMNFHYAGQPGEGYGWGCCNKNLNAALHEIGVCLVTADCPIIHTCFMPLADHDFNPVSRARGKVNLAYTFFEFPLGPNAAENAKKYDIVFAGSTWCLERMEERGITNGKLLIQGVDQNIFSPQPPRKRDGQFRIFSGGKFEYRKGQDLVMEAFRLFAELHDDARLICSWFNPWPHLIVGMNESAFLKEFCEILPGQIHDQCATFRTLFEFCGVDLARFAILPQLSQSDITVVMANTDCGLFPNRCEGGTNLVLMEYASCGRKVIANAKTGHADVADAITYEIPATTDENHWAVQSVDDIVAMLELAYESRHSGDDWQRNLQVSQWTWKAAAEKIFQEALALTSRNATIR